MRTPTSFRVSTGPFQRWQDPQRIRDYEGSPTMRQMTLVAFLQAQNCTNLPSSWRHPQSRSDAWSADYYRHIGRVLEEAE